MTQENQQQFFTFADFRTEDESRTTEPFGDRR